jgi:hypothetical protein
MTHEPQQHSDLTTGCSGRAAARSAAEPVRRPLMKLFRPGKKSDDLQFSFAADEKTRDRAREVQLLINVIEPNPEMQPWFLSDQAQLFDIGGHDDEEIRRKLSSHFRTQVRSDLSAPVWQLVDSLKHEFPGWPDIRHGSGVEAAA